MGDLVSMINSSSLSSSFAYVIQSSGIISVPTAIDASTSFSFSTSIIAAACASSTFDFPENNRFKNGIVAFEDMMQYTKNDPIIIIKVPGKPMYEINQLLTPSPCRPPGEKNK